MVPFALSRLGLSGRMPRPLVVVHSGNTQMMLFGFEAISEARVTRLASLGGRIEGGAKASRIARRRLMRSTLRV